MTRDDIIRMAQEAGAMPSGDPREGDVWLFQGPAMERFAALVAATEQPEQEPVGVMQESYLIKGLVIPVVTQELPVGTPLYAAIRKRGET
jgi:hypothetical protein